MSVSMNCHIEVKLNGVWHHWSAPRVYDVRIYGLMGCERYAKQAGPVPLLKVCGSLGLDSLSTPTRLLWQKEEADATGGYFWLNSEECAELHRHVRKFGLDPDVVFGLILENDLRMIDYPDEMPCDDYRMVYWFLW